MTFLPLVLAAPQTPAEQGQSDFLGWPMVAWTVGPFLLAIWLAKKRKRSLPEPPHVNDQTFEELVLHADRPVLVHFYRSWSVADRVVVNQARRIADRIADRAYSFWLDADANPETKARFQQLETPAFVYFVDGKRVFHAEGVVDDADVLREIALAHESYDRRRARDAAGKDPETPVA